MNAGLEMTEKVKDTLKKVKNTHAPDVGELL